MAHLEKYINQKIKEVHQNNIEAGWWTDLKTGESIIETRNRPEVMLLIVSELSEADFGYTHDISDDHLPHRLMAEVELGDSVIRLFDLLGAEGFYVGSEIDLLNFSISDDLTFTEALMEITNSISYALEGYRKNNTYGYRLGLIKALGLIFALSEHNSFDLQSAIEEKLEYNKNRQDHKISERVKSGGKKI